MNADHPNRRATRLRGFDYTKNRSYFVTVCTYGRCEILAEICRGGALLLPIGEIVDNEIGKLSVAYDVSVDRYVIMPNHIHMLLSLRNSAYEESISITDILCALKSRTTKLANKLDGQPGRRIWQRSFHDHIIRDQKDYQKIWHYIDENPMRWEEDCFYKNAGLQNE